MYIRTDGITLRGSGDFLGGTVIKPPAPPPNNLCTSPHVFGPTGVCIFAKKVNLKTGKMITPVYDDTVTGLYVTGFASNGVFGYGTYGLTAQRVVAVNDGVYGISRFESTQTLFANDTAIGNSKAGFYIGDSPNAATVVRDNVIKGNTLGIFVRHARGVTVMNNRVSGNCQGILVLDDGQPGGAGNAVIAGNSVFRNNLSCAANEDRRPLQGGGILLLGATQTTVTNNSVKGNRGQQVNSGGIVVLSAAPFGGRRSAVTRSPATPPSVTSQPTWLGRQREQRHIRRQPLHDLDPGRTLPLEDRQPPDRRPAGHCPGGPTRG